MKTVINYILTILLISSLIGCNRQIKGNEKEVKDIVIQLCQKELKNNLVSETFWSEKRLHSYPLGTYEILKERTGDVTAKYIIDKVDSIYNSFDIKVEDIRIIKLDKDANNVSCNAKLYLNEKESFNLIYNAQLTTDNDKVYVELIKFERN